MRRNAVLLALAAVGALAVAARDAQAQGFSVYEHDACAMARGGATVADPCPGGSAVFFNPAGVVGSPNKWNISFGGTAIPLSLHYRDSLTGLTTDNTSNTPLVPHVYVTRQINDRWAFGIGLYAPYGLIVQWPESSPGRFLAWSTDVKSLYLQPTLAFRPNHWLRLGAGLTYARTSVDLKQHVDLSSQTAQPGVTFGNLGIPVGTDFANGEIKGYGYSMAGHFGIILEPTKKISLGARYLMAMSSTVRGHAYFTQIGTGITLPPGNPVAPGGRPMSLDSLITPQFLTGALQTQVASGTIPLPDMLVVGAALKPVENFTLTGDYEWTHWANFSQLQLSFQNLPMVTLYEDFHNTNGWRFGAEYRSGNLALRGGFLTHDAASPDQTVTPLLPEGKRFEVAGGIGFRLGSRMTLDLAYQNIKQQARRGRVVQPPVRGIAGAAYNTGLYTGSANLFGASLHLAY